MMSQSPDDPLYHASNEHANDPSQQTPRAPGSARSAYPGRPGSSPNQGPLSQPGFPPQGDAPQSRPPSQPGFSPQGYQPAHGPVNPASFASQSYQRPASQPPQGYQRNQGPISQPGTFQQGYQPGQGPVSQPGFADQGYSQQGPLPVYTGQQSRQEAGLPPLPEPGSLPKQYNFPMTEHENGQRSGVPVHELPTSKLNAAPALPAKGRLRVGRILVSLFVLVLLIGGGVGAVLLLRHNNAKPQTTVHTTAAATSIPANGGVGTVGQPLQAGPNWVMTVTSVHANVNSDYPPKKGDTYLEISLTLKNVSPNTQFVSSMIEFTLTDSSGGQYTESVNDTYTRQAVDGHLTMNQALNGQVAYEVPQTRHHFVLTFHYGLPDGSSDAASWNISA